jgi:Mn-dependent DtxR family transcriptional regulator
VKQRCCLWLLQTHDRVDAEDFALKQEFLAVMLGVHRPTVTVVQRALQHTGLISSRYGRIRILKRKGWKQPRASATRAFGHIFVPDHRAGLTWGLHVG